MISYKDLIVWQKSMDLVVMIYQATENFPKSELYGLVSQIRRSSISIPSNIAEGKMRGTRKDYCHFVRMAFGSGAELETQLEISRRLKFVNENEFLEIKNLLEEIMKMLNVMIRKLGEPIT
ncbi:MAG TPA: hypothetical protein DEB09_01280 [Candidatus Magasanikbacteria bacterium]|nr:hypothetical protein [Candidatus Magasanikbacteria bacterium]